MRILLLLLFLLPVSLLAQPRENVKMGSVKIADGVKAELPEDFSTMTDSEIAQRFFVSRKPVAAYADAYRTIDFTFNTAPTQWKDGDVAMLRDFYKSNFRNLYTNVEFSVDTVKEINGKDFAVFEFISSVTDPNTRQSEKRYTYIQYTVRSGEILLFSFTAPVNISDKWRSTAAAIMDSVKVKG